jgi:hypothetical protein
MRARNACCGPSPSASRAAILSCARAAIRPKFSGNSTSLAPSAAAAAIRRSATGRLAATSSPDVIWIAATCIGEAVRGGVFVEIMQ